MTADQEPFSSVGRDEGLAARLQHGHFNFVAITQHHHSKQIAFNVENELHNAEHNKTRVQNRE
jgi:arginine utilization protein RocB